VTLSALLFHFRQEVISVLSWRGVAGKEGGMRDCVLLPPQAAVSTGSKLDEKN